MDNLNCPSWTTNLAYRGITTETHIEQCSHADYVTGGTKAEAEIASGTTNWQWGTHNCTHAQDIGVGCDNKTNSSKQGAYPGIRLRGGNGTYDSKQSKDFAVKGRVEVRKNGVWGTICNSNTDYESYAWNDGQTVDDRVAQVVCRHLGYTVGRLMELNIVTNGDSDKQIWLDNLACQGTEVRVKDCNHNDHTPGNQPHYWQWGTMINNCSHANDIGVGCDVHTTDSSNNA